MERGTKRKCDRCGMLFYDLLRNPAPCPKCGNKIHWVDPHAAERERREEEDRLRLIKEKDDKLKKERAAEIAAHIQTINHQFETDYLGATRFYQNNLRQHVRPDEFAEAKVAYVVDWLRKHTPLDSSSQFDVQQANAIGAVDFHTLVAARAGSGKTATLISRVLFLHKHCGVGPNEILMLAFNRDAAEEMRRRLKDASGKDFPHVMTFHALAYALVHPEEGILYDEPEGAQNRSAALQDIIDGFIRSPERRPVVQEIMLEHFRQDWERIVRGGYDRSPEEMIVHRRLLPREGLDGRYYKSEGEKIVANFLLEHDVRYLYEKNHWWNRLNYRPDFTLPMGEDEGVIIEYFGLQGEPDYDDLTAEKISYWNEKENWKLIQIYPCTLSFQNLEASYEILGKILEDNGVAHRRLSDDEVWERIKDRAVDRLTRVSANFIQRCRKQPLIAEELQKIIKGYAASSDAEEKFLNLMAVLFAEYMNRVEQTGQDDFDGLLQKAISAVHDGQTEFERKSGKGDFRKIRYVLIDEYQDFSQLFHNLMMAIKSHTPDANFFCVGDDWQAINGFAGSDLRFFRDFEEYYSPSRRLEVTTNYRSKGAIVEAGNVLMAGLGSPAIPSTSEKGMVAVGDLSGLRPSPREQREFPGDALTPAVLRIISGCLDAGQNVVLLSRKNSLPWYVDTGGADLSKFLDAVREYLPEQDRRRVKISTAHKYKGLQQDAVIILDAVERCYPLIHPDIVFTQIFGDTPEKIAEEERRLFYVALTRAVSSLYIITENGSRSPFLDQIGNSLDQLNWVDLKPLVKVESDSRVYILVGNAPGRGTSPTHAIKDLLKNAGFRWNPGDWPCWHIGVAATGDDPKEFIGGAEWSRLASGVEVRLMDCQDKIIGRCFIESGDVRWVE